MERKALISPVMDTLLLKGGADGRNWGLEAHFFCFYPLLTAGDFLL